MAITCDPKKRRITLQERGIDFDVDAERVFAGRVVTLTDERFYYGEIRLLTIGWLVGRMVIMVWTQRGADRHIISMRYCHAKEERKFLKLFGSA